MITPSDSPSSPSDYAGVTPHGRGPAPYNIQAASDEGAVQAAFAASIADAGSGVLYPQSARQRETETLLTSGQGYGEQDIDGGSAFGWPNNVEPGGM
jgi:hypothetical protein